MTIEDRYHEIATWVAQQGTVTVEQVVQRFGISPATARRDLGALADQMLIIRTRGGARAAAISGQLPLRYRAGLESDEKAAIARAAVKLIEPGQVVAFTGGTTTTQVAQELGTRVTSDPLFTERPLTVVTNAINIANDLIVRPELRIVLTGGVARMRSYELVGPLARVGLPLINVDVFFLGVNGIDLRRGFFMDDEAEADISAAVLSKSIKSYIVADHTKFDSTAFAKICDLDAVTGVITNDTVPEEVLDALRRHGPEVILA